jgi:RNA polymerase sigma-70 factor (ECF subfamily)
MEAKKNCRPGSFDKEAVLQYDTLLRRATGMTGNRMDAEDLVHETYLRAFRYWGNFEKGSNCAAWLSKIMANLHINRYRRAKIRPDTSSYDEIEDICSNWEPERHDYLQNPYYDARRILSDLFDDDLKEMFTELHEKYMILLLLRDIQGFSYAEIAGIIDTRMGTVKSRLVRARRKISGMLSDWACSHGYRV